MPASKKSNPLPAIVEWLKEKQQKVKERAKTLEPNSTNVMTADLHGYVAMLALDEQLGKFIKMVENEEI